MFKFFNIYSSLNYSIVLIMCWYILVIHAWQTTTTLKQNQLLKHIKDNITVKQRLSNIPNFILLFFSWWLWHCIHTTTNLTFFMFCFFLLLHYRYMGKMIYLITLLNGTVPIVHCTVHGAPSIWWFASSTIIPWKIL